jgi:hypothetical protein
MRRATTSQFELYLKVYRYLSEPRSVKETEAELDLSEGYVREIFRNMKTHGVKFESTGRLGRNGTYKIISTEQDLYYSYKIPLCKKEYKKRLIHIPDPLIAPVVENIPEFVNQITEEPFPIFVVPETPATKPFVPPRGVKKSYHQEYWFILTR